MYGPPGVRQTGVSRPSSSYGLEGMKPVADGLGSRFVSGSVRRIGTPAATSPATTGAGEDPGPYRYVGAISTIAWWTSSRRFCGSGSKVVQLRNAVSTPASR